MGQACRDAGMTIGTIVTRFAPSPTGYLHIGHALSALAGWRPARGQAGRFLLRIEDIDRTRCREAFDAAILEDLAWLGIDWDGEVRRQSRHLADYASVLAGLRARRLVYPCFCSRSRIVRESEAPHGPLGPVYPGTCRNLAGDEREARIAAGENHAWRLDVGAAARQAGPLTWRQRDGTVHRVDPFIGGDVVLGRRETPVSYHLAVTHDDHAQGVTVVTRGRDLEPSTHVHRLIQALMGWNEPVYDHHRLLLRGDGRRYAKRDSAATIRSLREEGHTPEAVLAMASS